MMSTTTSQLVFLQGKRVHLRPVLETDLLLLLQWINDPEVTRSLKVHLPMMEADQRAWFETLHTRKAHELVFVIVADARPIGTMGLHRINWRDRTATTGALIGEKEYWGKGYGSEAKMILLDYAFNALNLRKICSAVVAFNERSRRYNEKCGYTVEGVRRQHVFKDGRYWDEILMAVFRDAWLPLWEKFRGEVLEPAADRSAG